MRPISENSRALRRAYKEKMKSKAKKIYNEHSNPEHLADNLAMCSCWMCGNPRKHFNLDTLSEIKNDASFKSQLED